MTKEEMLEIFSEREGFGEFQDVETKLSNRPDLHAFLLLDKLNPSDDGECIIAAAEHDEIYLWADLDTVAKNATEEQINELILCGVFISEDSFAMFA